jgi:phage-related protein
MNSAEVLIKFKGDTTNLDKNTEKSSNLLKGFSNGIGKAFKAAAVGITAATAATGVLVKKSVEAYANYEQLIGGVETLFKDSASIVEGYANNAYKTAGLSANEYMETVTSFSASLLQSLNGDTAKSAEVADMAITDMADNANKMGTSMEMIQNAYQGFAKQNYTMLDNLKLGYGGTKTEMERLLADATKISGVKYDISSLNDVYQAIHVIQGELGITGTTAKEASTTISGSLNSMKSAWQNLLTGISDDNADFNKLVNNFVDSAVTAGENILPRISEALNGVGLLITDFLPILITKLAPLISNFFESIISGINENLPDIITSAMNLIKNLASSLIKMLPTILKVGIQIVISLIQGIAQELPNIIPEIIKAVLLIVETLINNIDLLIDAGIQLIIGLAEGIIEALPIIIDKMPILIDKLITALINNLPKILQMGITLIVKLAEGLIKAIPQLISKIPQIISSLINGIKSYFGNMISLGSNLAHRLKEGISNGIAGIGNIGKNLVQGLWNGINNAKQWILDKIKGFGKAVLKGLKSFFGIHSPSTLMEDEIGQWLPKGIAVGIDANADSVRNAMKDMQESISSEFGLSPQLTESMNSNLSPTINVQNNVSMETDPLGQVVSKIKTFSGGAKNDYNYGMGV